MAITDAQLIQIENQALALNARSDRVTAQINDYVATVNADPSPSSEYVSDGKALEAEAVDTLGALNSFNNSPAVLEVRAYGDLREQQRVNNALEVIRGSRTQTAVALEDVRSTMDTIGTREPAPEDATNSASQIISNDASGRAEDATNQTPQTSPDPIPSILVSNNADETELKNTTTAAGAEEVNNTAEDTGGTANSAGQYSQGVNGIPIPGAFLQNIQTRSNKLTRLSSYTYNITIYMISPQQFSDFMYSLGSQSTSGGIDTFNWRTIVKSGGMPPAGTLFETGVSTVGFAQRDPNFNHDFFIDDLQIDTLLPQQVRGATNVTGLSFKITEPYGFTFIEKLKRSSKDLQGSVPGSADWLKQHYVMQISFHGYDENGNPVNLLDTEATDGGVENGVINVTANVLTEKFIPFKFTNITTKATTGAVEYDCQAIPINHAEAMSQKRSSMKYQIEINGQTLDDIFNGKYATSGGSQSFLSTGLKEAIDNYYQDAVKNKSIEEVDRISFTFLEPALAKSKVRPPGNKSAKRTPMADNTTPLHLAQTAGKTQSERYTISVNAGQQMQNFIDQTIRLSDWVTKQQKYIIDPVTREKKEQASNSLLQWYRITSTVTNPRYDSKRNDFAYDIEYRILPSAVYDVRSSYFPVRPFRGVHKRYNYWFTGENTEVLDYQVDYNALYYVSSSPDIPNDADTAEKEVGETKSIGPSEQSIQGGADLSSDGAARAAASLYSPSDYAILNMSILGDPDYIVQGDVLYPSELPATPGFLKDGSIDFDTDEVLVEVNFRTMTDYNEETGSAELTNIDLKTGAEKSATTLSSGEAYNGLIYQITQVTSKFNKGVFTQDLSGVLKQFATTRSVQADPTPVTTTQQSSTNQIRTLPPQADTDQNLIVQGPPQIPTQVTKTQGPIIPTLGGLQLTGAQYVAPPDDQ